MISSRWLERRKEHWMRLESIVVRAGRHGTSSLTHQDLRDLALLYRQTAVDLSTVREDPADRRFAGYLNQLLGRAHNIVYRVPRADRRSVIRFYGRTFPRVFRETFGHTAVAFLIFMFAAVAGWFITLGDPGFQRYILGGEMVDTIERRQMWTHGILAMKPVATSGIMTNNLAVCLTVAAAGITGGLGTLFMMLNNGLLLGVVGAACWRNAMSVSLWSFVSPHGALELPAFFIAGGAGLLIAEGLLFPGMLPRRVSLSRAGRRATTLILGVIPMLVLAAVIEGFISPTGLAVGLKFALGAGGLLVVGLHLGWRGSARPADPIRSTRAP